MTDLIQLTEGFAEQAKLDFKPVASQLVQLANALHSWNQKINLTAAQSPEAILNDHLFDSLTLVPFFAKYGGANVNRWADIGSGGGFPGLPLSIALPGVEFIMIESIGKKCRALEAMIAQLGLANCSVKCARAETLGQSPEWRGSFQYSTARALGSFSVQAELGLPLLAVGGLLLLQKSEKGEKEIEQESSVLGQLGGELIDIKHLEIRGFLSSRLVAIVRKTNETPDKYPRRPGIPARRPLA